MLEQNSSEEKDGDVCLEPTNKKQRLSDDEQDTASNSSGNEFGSDYSPEGIFFDESESIKVLFNQKWAHCVKLRIVFIPSIKRGDKFYT